MFAISSPAKCNDTSPIEGPGSQANGPPLCALWCRSADGYDISSPSPVITSGCLKDHAARGGGCSTGAFSSLWSF